MNPVLSYAIEHQAKAKAILCGIHGVPLDDVDDVAQDVLLNIFLATPGKVDRPGGYWLAALHNTAMRHHQRNARQPLPVTRDSADPRQDPEATAIRREALRDAWAAATPAERRAIVQVLTEPIPVIPGKTRIPLCRLRRRLRERAVA